MPSEAGQRTIGDIERDDGRDNQVSGVPVGQPLEVLLIRQRSGAVALIVKRRAQSANVKKVMCRIVDDVTGDPMRID